MAKTVDGRTMVFVRSSALFLWNAETPDTVMPVTPPPGWEPIRRVATPKRVSSARPPAPTRPPRRFRDRPDRARRQTASTCSNKPGPGKPLHVWAIERPDSTSPAQARDLDWAFPLTDGAISIALRGDGTLLAVGDRTGTVTLVDTLRRRVVGKIPPASGDSESYWLALAFSPDGQDLAIGSPDRHDLALVGRPAEQAPAALHLPGHRGPSPFWPSTRAGAGQRGDTDPLVEVWDLDLSIASWRRLGLAD